MLKLCFLLAIATLCASTLAAPPTNADPPNPASPQDVITQRNNNLRTGTSAARGMNPSFVSDGRFGRLASLNVDGVVLAQPLYMASVDFPSGRRPAIFVATSSNWVYAFDADSLAPEPLWKHNLGPPLKIDNAFTETNLASCTVQMAWTERDDRGEATSVLMGIESTPAIDLKNGRLIVSYRMANSVGDEDGSPRITALDIRTGQVTLRPDGSPLDRAVIDRENNNDFIWNKLHRNRASVLIDNGIVYLAFSSRCEGFGNGFNKAYQGWIYAFDTQTLNFAGRYRTTQTPQGVQAQRPSEDPVQGGGIWQASTGPAADGQGNLFFSTGNARPPYLPPDADGKNLSSSVIRLSVSRPAVSPGSAPRVLMSATDWFTPYRKLWQDGIDLDLGSAGVVLIPNTPFLVTGGKEGILYLLNRNNLGKFDDKPPFKPEAVQGQTTATARDESNRDHVVQKLPIGINQYCDNRRKQLFCFRDSIKNKPKNDPNKPQVGVTMNEWIAWPHIHGTPVYGAFPNGRAFLYVWPEKDHLKSFSWQGNRFNPISKVATILPDYRLAALAPPYLMDFTGAVGMPGGMLSLAVDSSQQGSGVLFASVQRCRQSKDERSRPECMYSLCDNPENCKEQRYGSLRAFDPFTMKELWNNQMDPFASDEDKNYWFAKFVPPTIGHGRVFLATASNRVLVYGRQPVIRPLNRPPQLEPRQILARMTASNLGNSVGDATLLDWMTGDNRYYRRLAHACLEVLGSKRLVATATDLDKVNFFYLQYFGMDDEVGIASDHSFSKRALQRALLLAHNDKNGGTAKLLAEVMR